MIAPYVPPDHTAQDFATWKSMVDNAAVAMSRVGVAFKAEAQSTPNMTVRVLAGALLVDGVLTEIAAQNTGTITAPVTNPRIDRVVIDAGTGAVSVVTGTEDPSPVAPAIPSGKLPVCRVSLATSTAAITASLLTDERARPTGSAALRNVGTGPNDVPTNGDISTGSRTITAGENLADRDLIYLDYANARGNGADRWYKVDTDATGPVRISARLGIALAAISSGATGLAQVYPGRVSGFTSLTAGGAVWASATAGGITQTAPAIPGTGTQIALRQIGFAASATAIDFAPEDDTLFVRTADALSAGASATVEHWPDAGAPDRVPFAHALGSAFVTTASRSNGTPGTSWTGYSIRAKVAAAQISTSGNRVRVTLRSGGQSLSILNCYIGEVAASGNAWDFAATPTRITFDGGSNGFSGLSSSTDKVSDDVAFALDETKTYIVSFDVSNSGGPYGLDFISPPTGWTPYEKTGGAADAGSVAPSGYSTGSQMAGLTKIEVSTGSRREPEPLFPEARFSSATDKVTCRYDDGAGSAADTKTTFINRTGAARDLVVEVVL